MRKAAGCVLLAILCLLGASYLPRILQEAQTDREQQNLISGYIQNPDTTDEENTESTTDEPEEETDPNMERIVDFQNLQQINPEILAWITVPGTPIDYPVALGEDNSYYLNHTVTGESNILGSIFATAGTDFEESHIILYGHNMASGKMFGSLKKYHDKDFRNAYPYVYVYTPETTYTCAIYSVYSTRYDSDVFTLGYKGDSEEWKQWIAETVQNAEYDCNIAPTGKEKVFTLSTCVGDGSSPYRLVIHAVTVAQKEVANAERKRLKAKVRARICMILACLLLCGTGVSLWNGKRAEKSVSNIDTGQKSSKTVSNIDTGTENHQAVSNVDTDTENPKAVSNVDTSTEKPQAVSNVDTAMETTKQVSNIDTDTEGMILKADPVDTADRNHICFFAVFFIGSWSVLMFLTAIRKRVRKILG